MWDVHSVGAGLGQTAAVAATATTSLGGRRLAAPDKRKGVRMGFVRKATFLGTGGVSGVAFKANSKKERAANAAEKQLALQKKVAARLQTEAAIAAGAWWLDRGTFKGLFLPITGVRYLGGLPAGVARKGAESLEGRRLEFTQGGFKFGGAVRADVRLEWAQVESLEVESVQDSPRRAVAAADTQTKQAVVVVRTGGAEALFLVEGMTPEGLRSKLERITQAIRQSHPVPSRQGASQPRDLVDELARLARLHDAGSLSEEEFAAAKAAVLSQAPNEVEGR